MEWIYVSSKYNYLQYEYSLILLLLLLLLLFRFSISDPKGISFPGYGVWDGLRALWYPKEYYKESEDELTQKIEPEGGCYIYYNPVLSFQKEPGNECYTIHNTKIHKKDTNEFVKALRFKKKDNRTTKLPYIVADINVPIPLLMFLSLCKESLPYTE